MTHERVIIDDNSPQLKIGKRIAFIRGETKSKDFAMSLGVHPNSITNYENDKRFPDLNFLALLVEDYGVNLNWLLTGDGNVYADSVLSNRSAGNSSMTDEKTSKVYDREVFEKAFARADQFEKDQGCKISIEDKLDMIDRYYGEILRLKHGK